MAVPKIQGTTDMGLSKTRAMDIGLRFYFRVLRMGMAVWVSSK
jgi:hypothetical protein